MRSVSWIARGLGCLTLVAAALATLAGCGKKTTDVTGTVTVNGKAPNLEGLGISFVGADGRPVTTAVAKDGSFKASGVPLGETQVGLTYAPPEAEESGERSGKNRPSG